MSTAGKTTPEQNKAIVLKAFDTLFNRHNYEEAADFWSTNYLQHSAHIPPGRDGLFGLVRSLPGPCATRTAPLWPKATTSSSRAASAIGTPTALITVDIVRIENGKLAEHWDVWQDEATQANFKSGLPMFGDRFPA